MNNYCLEHDLEESGSTIIHKLDCLSYDLGSLLGAGRLFNLGAFENSVAALDAVKGSHPDAIRCLDCCHAELVLPAQAPPGSVRGYATA